MKCQNCGAEAIGMFCSYCGAEIPQDNNKNGFINNNNNATTVINNYYVQQSPQGYYQNPQTNMNNNARQEKGDYQRVYNSNESMESDKSKIVALILCVFLGYLGVHYFYVGKTGWGVAYILTVGFFGIGWFVDIFRIAVDSFTDVHGRKLS